MRGVGVGVEQADRDRLGREPPHARRHPPRLGVAEPHPRAPAGVEPLARSEPQAVRHQRLDPPRRERVEVGAVLAADLDQVLEARGGDERDPGPAALEQGVRGHGGAEAHAGARGGAEAPEPLERGALRGPRRGGALERHELSVHQRREVGEGAAGVHAHGAARPPARRDPAPHGSFRMRRIRWSTSTPSTITPAPASSQRVGSLIA